MPKLNLCGDIGLKIGRDGTWYYQGGPIGRKGLVKLFASVLRLEEGGRYYLVTPVEKVPIAVEAMPFLAVEMVRKRSGESQTLSFRSNVDDVVAAALSIRSASNLARRDASPPSFSFAMA